MTQSNNIPKEWKDLLDNQMNIDKSDNWSDYIGVSFPLAKQVSAKSIALDLNFASEEEIDKVKSKVLSENREGLIDSLINDEEFIEKKLEDDEEYKELMKKGVTPLSSPSGNLMYLDYKYKKEKKIKIK